MCGKSRGQGAGRGWFQSDKTFLAPGMCVVQTATVLSEAVRP